MKNKDNTFQDMPRYPAPPAPKNFSRNVMKAIRLDERQPVRNTSPFMKNSLRVGLSLVTASLIIIALQFSNLSFPPSGQGDGFQQSLQSFGSRAEDGFYDFLDFITMPFSFDK